MHKTILILDDDAQRRAVHAFGLRCAGFSELLAMDVRACHADATRPGPALVLLFGDRLDARIQSLVRLLCSAPAPHRPTLIAILSAVTAADSATARKLGIRECLAGPIAPQTLVDSVQAWLNLRGTLRSFSSGLEVDLDSGVLSRRGRTVALSPTERRLLAALIERPERVLSRAQLIRRVHSERAANPGRLIDISVCRLRRSLKRLDCPGLLQTIRGRGYRLTLREGRPGPAEQGDDPSAGDTDPSHPERGNAPAFSHDYTGATQ